MSGKTHSKQKHHRKRKVIRNNQILSLCLCEVNQDRLKVNEKAD